MDIKKLQGVFTALVTPFTMGSEAVDEKALRNLVRLQLKGGVAGIVPCGTTGEASTLDYEEHERVIQIVIECVNGKVPVIAGTGSNSTKEAIELTEAAKKIGADMCLLTTPYYNKPTQEGLYWHYKKIAEEVDIPLVLYNIPSRTGINMEPATVKRLAEIPNIVAIKEASGSLVQVAEIFRLVGRNFSILSGDDNLFLPMMSVGAVGVISVASNIIPEQMGFLYKDFKRKKTLAAADYHAALLPLFQGLFFETNPLPVKTALHLMGLIEEEFRLPLCPMSISNKRKLFQLLKEYNLIS